MNSPHQKNGKYRWVARAVVKALVLFVALNLLFAVVFPVSALGRVTAYNHLFPGRLRLPYSDTPGTSYSLSPYNLDAMFAAHELSAGEKPDDEFRVLLLGDSSTWGFLLPAQQTLSAQLNSSGIETADGRQVRFYNLGYPVMSLTKDLLMLSHGMRYEPDLVVWLLTLESFPVDKQLFPPLLLNNPDAVRELASDYDLDLDIVGAEFEERSFWERSIIGARRELADWLRLQLYGVMWAATGIDQHIPEVFTPLMEDLPADDTFHNLTPPVLHMDDLAIDVLAAGIEMAGDVPVLIVNEPMFISQGENSDVRYNFYYPRWAYDGYRELIQAESDENGWHYIDLWDSVPADEFTNSAVHISPAGVGIFAGQLIDAIREHLADRAGGS